MASRAGTGIEMDLDRVPQRAADMTPYELLLSESQERMLMVSRQGREEQVCEIFRRWGLDAMVVGRVTDDGRMKIRWHGETVVDIPVDPVAAASPELDRPIRRPAALDERQKLDVAGLAGEEDPEGALLALLDSPNLCSKAWVVRQYDQLVQGNTLIGPGGDAALVRVRREDGTPTGKALAIAADCNPRWCWLDPFVGAQAAVAESARNVACTGARPLALTNCLNFGNPEKPEIMWEFAEAVRGLAEAAETLGTPVVSGNVSFYNETKGRAIHPTPNVVMVGLLDDEARHAVSWFRGPGRAVVLLGETRDELGGSEWLAQRAGREAGLPPRVDLEHEKRLHALLREGVAAGEIETAHDVSDGGLAVALAECCFGAPGAAAPGPGARVALAGTVRPEALLFGESTGRVLAASEAPDALLARARAAGVPAARIGETGGDRLVIAAEGGGEWIDRPVAELHEAWSGGLPRRLEVA
jgi:phosphoribosylformylglycinamidine synthase